MASAAICRAAEPTTHAAPEQQWKMALRQKISQIKRQLAVSEKLLMDLRAKGLPEAGKHEELLKWLKSTSPTDARRYWEMQTTKWGIREGIVELWLSTLDPNEIAGLDYIDLSDPSHAEKILGYYEKMATEKGDEKLSSLLLKNLPKTIQAANSPYAWVSLEGIYRWFTVVNRAIVSDAEGFVPVTQQTIQQIHQSLHAWYRRSRHDFKWDEQERQFINRDGSLIHLPPAELHFDKAALLNSRG
jgi:hypothetical protein